MKKMRIRGRWQEDEGDIMVAFVEDFQAYLGEAGNGIFKSCC